MSTTQPLLPFLATREIDYTIKQKLLVMAADAADADARLNDFAEGTDWGANASLTHRVVQLADEMEQIEDTCEVSIRQLTDDPVQDDDKFTLVQMQLADVCLDSSLARLGLEQKAQAMWDLLQKVNRGHQLNTADLSELALEVKTFVETELAAQARSQAVLTQVKQ